MNFLKQNLILIVIITIAILLRFVNLASIPIGFNDDEAAFGYNAYSILKTGHDEWGRLLPFPVFESFGDWKLVGYLYPTVVTVFLFGLNEFAVRFPSALFGAFTVIATYFLAKELFAHQNWKFEIGKYLKFNIPIVASLLLAISPWHIIASRNAFESDLLSFFITIAVYFFLKSLRQKSYFKFSAAFFILSFYIYRSAWLFVPLFVLTICYLHKITLKKIGPKIIVTALVLILPLIPVILTFKGQSRFLQESFITSTARIGITNDVNYYRGSCSAHLQHAVCSLVYNKYIFLAKSYIANYFKNLSYDSFFEKASPTGFQSYATRGVFYLFELPLFIYGLIYLFSKKHQSLKILIPWILIAPLGASIAGIGNYGRLNLILPAPQLIEAAGLIGLLSSIKLNTTRRLVLSSIVLVIAFSVVKLWADLSYIEPIMTSRYQRYGYKQLFDYLKSQETNYEHFYISKKIDNSHQYIQYLFFEKVDPNYLVANAARPHAKDGWVNFQNLGRYNFVDSTPGLENILPKSLLIAGEKEASFPVGPIHTIKYLNGDVGFEVYDVDKVKLEQIKTR